MVGQWFSGLSYGIFIVISMNETFNDVHLAAG